MRDRLLILVALVTLLSLVLLGCSMGGSGAARITATPTKTMRPLFTTTHTPTATPRPTDTPLPTATPLPPTDTPLPTETLPPPTATPLPPTNAPPTETSTAAPAPPTATLRPAATNTPAPPTVTPKPQVDFRVVEQRLMTKADNEAQLHMVLIRVVDAAGNPLNGLAVWDPNTPDQEAVTGTKPEPYHAEYLFWDYDGYQLEVKGARSDKTKVLSTDVFRISKEDLVGAGYCADVANCNPAELVQHFSWFVTFQRTW